ncbi:hypothetical protein I7I53_01199 [Histoplasma capsulatum var. duboisii H88]|uniref:Uncharacterized protein n=1 Tax=Ajellomyces capsulatus (strain H88) TaxID=544711 RepID=A0A8A1LIY3_AJEC8|nr:hypothetical protein I7I53_01199 [Histoplasma capsulatum var. duboisii H88]
MVCLFDSISIIIQRQLMRPPAMDMSSMVEDSSLPIWRVFDSKLSNLPQLELASLIAESIQLTEIQYSTD